MLDLTIDYFTRIAMTVAYILCEGNKKQAAHRMRMSRSTFTKKYEELKIMTMVEDVAEFHRQGGTIVPDTIRFDPKAMALVLMLLESEQREVVAGVSRCDLANVCNEFLDMIYVALQGLIRTGLKPEQITELWNVLHQANMTKVDPARGLLHENAGRPYVDHRGSFLKPPGFRPVDFGAIIERMRRGKDET